MESDLLASRLVRLGYNTVRIHHYEKELVQGQKTSDIPNLEKLEKFDYLFAALKKRGVYLTTDLFVSRPVPWREIGVEKAGDVPMDTFKILVPVHPGAWENWKRFSRNLLTHVNPYTQLRYADDPALAWLSMINEGNFGNFMKQILETPEWKTAWNEWLRRQYTDRETLAKAWGTELLTEEDPSTGSVSLPAKLDAKGLRVRDCIVFFTETERDMVRRMKNFLRDELGCQALITNCNAWTNFILGQEAREIYDYVDDHFYVDHPEWVDRPWQLPSRSRNTSPIFRRCFHGANARLHTALRQTLYDHRV